MQSSYCPWANRLATNLFRLPLQIGQTEQLTKSVHGPSVANEVTPGIPRGVVRGCRARESVPIVQLAVREVGQMSSRASGRWLH